MLVLEALFGLAGFVAVPIGYAWLRVWQRNLGWV